MNAERQDGMVRLELEGEVTIYTAQQTKQNLLEGLARGSGLEADLSRVDEFDSVGLQLLLLARTEAERAGKSFRLVGFSAVVEDVLGLCQLTDWLDEQPVRVAH
ncbi:MAG TPA: STAS domain-containing protein [Parasulfuritortus sp.]